MNLELSKSRRQEKNQENLPKEVTYDNELCETAHDSFSVDSDKTSMIHRQLGRRRFGKCGTYTKRR